MTPEEHADARLARMEHALARIERKTHKSLVELAVLAEQAKSEARSQQDHEQRIRRLERWRTALMAMLAAGGGGVLKLLHLTSN